MGGWEGGGTLKIYSSPPDQGECMGSRVQQIWLFLENKEYRPSDGCNIEI
jgi:hypothetical protein